MVGVTGAVLDGGQGWSRHDAEAPMVALLGLGDSGYESMCEVWRKQWKSNAGLKSTLPCSYWRGGLEEFVKLRFEEESRVAGLLPMLQVAGNHDLEIETIFHASNKFMPSTARMRPTRYYWSTRLGPVYLIAVLSEIGRKGEGFPHFDDTKSGSNVSEVVEYIVHKTGTSKVNAQIQAKFSLELIDRGVGLQQLAWLEEELLTAWQLKRDGEVTWTVVLSHRNSRFGGYCSKNFWECLTPQTYKEKRHQLPLHTILEKLFFKYEVDMHLSGHTHQYERTYPVYEFQPVKLNSSAPVATAAESKSAGAADNTEEKNRESQAAESSLSYPPLLPNQTQPAPFAPVYVVAPAASWGQYGLAKDWRPADINIRDEVADLPGELTRSKPASWVMPQPPNVAKRLSPRAWGHLELLASTEKLRLEFHGRLFRDDPRVEVLDAVEYGAAASPPAASSSGRNREDRASTLEQRASIVANFLGGRHEVPSTKQEQARCVEAVRREAPPSLVVRPPTSRDSFARSCLEGNRPGPLWRTVVDVSRILHELTWGWETVGNTRQQRDVLQAIRRKRFTLALGFQHTLNMALVELLFPRHPSPDELMIHFVEFTFCPPAACDKVDLAGAVALPALLNWSRQLGVPVGFDSKWFAPSYLLSSRCVDMDCALRLGVFEDGTGEMVPKIFVVPPDLEER
eukprot:TRINITY_DN61663_c0_g1_i1.p1 TRINITY_DN61663_c0_g1~~TRINITY_DN61663_c0_g1_i1.p1  ORF type:complete len:779 (-),score=109.84 TRINITY_DN61663_c0_g1_i1:161-2206(-)